MIFVIVAVLIGTCHSQFSRNSRFCPEDPATRLLLAKNKMDFALKLLKHSSAFNESSFLSPFTIITALSVLYQGAGSDIQSEMTTLDGGQFAQIFGNLGHCISSSTTNAEGELSQEDSTFGESAKLWMEKDFPMNPNFRSTIVTFHDMTIEEIKFMRKRDYIVAQKAARWLKKNDHGRTNNVIFINFDFWLFFVKELHFEAKWKYQFLPLDIETNFDLSPTETINLPMMRKTEKFPFYEDENVEVISLPFEKFQMQMIIILPKLINGLEELEMELTGEKLNNYIDSLVINEMTVIIPKISTRKEFELSDGLEKMGLQSIFNESANFNDISDQTLFVTKHIGNVASMKITEEGINIKSTNTSSKDIEMLDYDLYSPTIRIFDATHPFLYVISDNQKNILWIGRYIGINDKLPTGEKMNEENMDMESEDEDKFGEEEEEEMESDEEMDCDDDDIESLLESDEYQDLQAELGDINLDDNFMNIDCDNIMNDNDVDNDKNE
uniref:SERPIN domain-containing protein n=1 Tax=Onchocerca volvulus TaxID=6282 RepID=A0A8R1TNH9_ONCVO